MVSDGESRSSVSRKRDFLVLDLTQVLSLFSLCDFFGSFLSGVTVLGNCRLLRSPRSSETVSFCYFTIVTFLPVLFTIFFGVSDITYKTLIIVYTRALCIVIVKPDLSLGKSLNCIKSLIGCFFNGRDLGRDAKTYGFPAGSIFLSPLPFFLAPSPSPPSFSHPRLPHKIEPARRLLIQLCMLTDEMGRRCLFTSFTGFWFGRGTISASIYSRLRKIALSIRNIQNLFYRIGQ